MSATISRLDTSTPPARTAARPSSRRFATASIGIALLSVAALAWLIADPGAAGPAVRGPAWTTMLAGWGTGALGLLATLIVPIAVGEGVSRIIQWRSGARRGMLIWACTTLATAYLLSLALIGALATASPPRDPLNRSTLAPASGARPGGDEIALPGATGALTPPSIAPADPSPGPAQAAAAQALRS